MNPKLLNNQDKQTLLDMIQANYVTEQELRYGETLYTVKTKNGKSLATVLMDEHYGTIVIRIGKTEVASINFTRNPLNTDFNNIRAVTQAMECRAISSAKEQRAAIRAKIQPDIARLKGKALKLGLTEHELIMLLQDTQATYIKRYKSKSENSK